MLLENYKDLILLHLAFLDVNCPELNVKSTFVACLPLTPFADRLSVFKPNPPDRKMNELKLVKHKTTGCNLS